MEIFSDADDSNDAGRGTLGFKGQYVFSANGAKLNDNGTLTVTFEGKLQNTPAVKGPWKDVSGASPLVLPADQSKWFGRAVR